MSRLIAYADAFVSFQIGSFFMINLCLVVIATQFSETKKRETERMLQERRRFQSTSTLASNSEPGGCYNELLKYIARLYRRAKRKLIKLYYEKTGKNKNQRKIKPELSVRKRKRKGTHNHHHCHHRSKCPKHTHYHYVYVNHESMPAYSDNPLAPRASPEMSEIDPVSSPRNRAPYLTVPSFSVSTQPSSESLNTLAIAAADILTPSLFKNYVSSPNHLSPHVSHSRTPSFSGESVKHLQFLPDVISQSSKNTALAASNTLVNEECDRFKFRLSRDKGKYFRLCLVVCVTHLGDKK